MGWLNRYRHSKGFGIHSPFAYRFITEVIEETIPFYDYVTVTDRHDRLIYRIACRFNPSTIGAVGSADTRAAMLACPKAKITDKPELLICAGDYSMEAVAEAIERHAVIIVTGINKKMAIQLNEALNAAGYGMIFSNERDTLIIVANPKLPRQTFGLRF